VDILWPAVLFGFNYLISTKRKRAGRRAIMESNVNRCHPGTPAVPDTGP